VTVTSDDPTNDVPPRRKGFIGYIQASLQRNYFLINDTPPLVLPSAPTDKEKLHYLTTHRVFLCFIGVLAFVTSSGGIWLFTICGPMFYWFGVFAGLLQLYLALFHLIGIVSRNFDYKHHEQVVKDYAITPEAAPTVDIYLPCCKEPLEILENTYKYVQKLEYPAGRLNVYVLDDGAMDEVKTLATRYGFHYICRDDRPRLKKAGNLRWAFARTSGEFFVIYDADFCPRHDYLLEIIPRMKEDSKIAIIQTPQYFRTLDDQTWVERGAGAVQELFYRYIQVCICLFLITPDRLIILYFRSIGTSGVEQFALALTLHIAERRLSKLAVPQK
jgi:Glycosyl transferase family 2